MTETLTAEENRRRWLFASFERRYFTRRHRLRHEHDRWRKIAELQRLSRAARGRLEWIIFWERNRKDVSLTARHFAIARKTFYKWIARFEKDFLRGLEDESRIPHRRRRREYTPNQYENVVFLRRQHLRYGKMKLLELYRRRFPGDTSISAWKIQCIIKTCGLYYHPQHQARVNRKRVRMRLRRKITELEHKPVSGFLLCLDTIVRYWQGEKRYILTAIDRHTKVAFARMYTTHTSSSARDFLRRLHFLLDGKIENIQTDNGSEFQEHFDAACASLGLEHYWSRAKTPKDNAVNERFNRTLQDEFLSFGNMVPDPTEFNRRLTDWLVEYNFRRPHQALRYLPPINFTFRYHKVLPMYPSRTPPFQAGFTCYTEENQLICGDWLFLEVL
jgi:transposase InsO family protein